MTRVVISFQGIDTVIANLTTIEEKAGANLQKLTKELAQDTQSAWQRATPRRSGRMQAADQAIPRDLSFILVNTTRYYDWVDLGHMTPRGWRRRSIKHGWVWRWAKRRSHVAAKNITRSAVDFIEANIQNYLSKFLR